MKTSNDKTVAKKTVVDVLNYTNETQDVKWYEILLKISKQSLLIQLAVNLTKMV